MLTLLNLTGLPLHLTPVLLCFAPQLLLLDNQDDAKLDIDALDRLVCRVAR